MRFSTTGLRFVFSASSDSHCPSLLLSGSHFPSPSSSLTILVHVSVSPSPYVSLFTMFCCAGNLDCDVLSPLNPFLLKMSSRRLRSVTSIPCSLGWFCSVFWPTGRCDNASNSTNKSRTLSKSSFRIVTDPSRNDT